MPQLQTLADGSYLYPGKRLTRHLLRLAPGRLLATHAGYDDNEGNETMLALWLDEARKSGPLHIFVDASRQTGMSAEARDLSGGWIKANRAAMGGACVLFRSRLMDIAMSLMSMVSGQRGFIQSFSDPREFDTAIAKVVPGFRSVATLSVPVSRAE